MKTNIALIVSCLLLSLTGCKKNGCFESSGTTTLSVRTITAFNEIHAYDNVSIILTQDTVNAVTIEAGGNLQPYIKADIDSNVLTFHNNSGCSWLKGPSESIIAHVSVKALSRIELHGSGNISSANTLTSDIFLDAYEAISSVTLRLQVQTVNLAIREENADYNLSGTAGQAYLYCGQKGTMNLQNLEVTNMDIDQRSIRDAYIWVTGALTVKVEYKGNVYYKDNPASINYQHFDDGRLLPL